MAQWNNDLYQQKLATLRTFPDLPGETTTRVFEKLRSFDDWALSRLNARRLADQVGRPFDEVLDVLLHGVRLGVFDFRYNLICPLCGGLEHNYGKIDELAEGHFHCTACEADSSADLDGQAEVAFSLSAAIAKLDLDWPKQEDGFRRNYFSDNYPFLSGFRDHIRARTVGAFRVSPGESAAFSFELVSEEPVQLLCPEIHAQAKIIPQGERHAGSWIVDMDLTERGFSPDFREVGPGPVEVRVRNATGRVVGIAGLRKKKEQFQAARSAGTFKPHAWLTARDLLNHQTFRDLFKAQDLSPNLRLSLKSLTLLFTDLKGSTEMYDRAGDFHAYRVVQEHFEILTSVVRKRHGAMIKTMGDAIMAAFSVPTDAVEAAIDMKKAIEEKNADWKKDGYDMGLKVGVHEGSALAVNADDRLDYFGQTVNIAARVQGLSGAGEIWLTENVYDSSGVSDLLRAGKFSVRKQSALLKGVGKPVTVLQCRQGETNGVEKRQGSVRTKPGRSKARAKKKSTRKKT